MVYDKAKAVRDQLAKELADFYPAFAQKLVELLARVVINDGEIDRINNALPQGAVATEKIVVPRRRGFRGQIKSHSAVGMPGFWIKPWC